jgi:hypothetical protein
MIFSSKTIPYLPKVHMKILFIKLAGLSFLVLVSSILSSENERERMEL